MVQGICPSETRRKKKKPSEVPGDNKELGEIVGHRCFYSMYPRSALFITSVSSMAMGHFLHLLIWDSLDF